MTVLVSFVLFPSVLSSRTCIFRLRVYIFHHDVFMRILCMQKDDINESQFLLLFF